MRNGTFEKIRELLAKGISPMDIRAMGFKKNSVYYVMHTDRRPKRKPRSPYVTTSKGYICPITGWKMVG